MAATPPRPSQVVVECAAGSAEQVGQPFDLGDGQRDQARVVGWLIVGVGRGGAVVLVNVRIAAAVTAQAAKAIMTSARWRNSAV